MIKPIDTLYKGHNFRSRLEARWAVFFDACGAEWEYEPQGFALPDGQYYLPDFLIHRAGLYDAKTGWDCADIYVEIKGEMSRQDADKISQFKEEYPIIILGELPYGNIDSIDDGIQHHGKMDFFHAPYFQLDTALPGLHSPAYPGIDQEGKFGFFSQSSRYLYRDDKATEKAYKEASLARFEHGEHPNPSRPKQKVDKDKVIYVQHQGLVKELYSLATRKDLQGYIQENSIEGMIKNFQQHTRSLGKCITGWLINLDEACLQYLSYSKPIFSLPFDEIDLLKTKAKEQNIELDHITSDDIPSGIDAMWARFFELCNLEYEYRPSVEGTDFVPNFFLPQVRLETRCSNPIDLYVVTNNLPEGKDVEDVREFIGFDVVDNYPVIKRPTLIVDGMPFGEDPESYCTGCQNLEWTEEVYPFNFYSIDGDYFQATPGVDKNGDFDLYGADSSYLTFMDRELSEKYYDQAAGDIW